LWNKGARPYRGGYDDGWAPVGSRIKTAAEGEPIKGFEVDILVIRHLFSLALMISVLSDKW
jgi:hypothetical protein